MQGCLSLVQGCLALVQGCLDLDQGSLALERGSLAPLDRSTFCFVCPDCTSLAELVTSLTRVENLNFELEHDP